MTKTLRKDSLSREEACFMDGMRGWGYDGDYGRAHGNCVRIRSHVRLVWLVKRQEELTLD